MSLTRAVTLQDIAAAAGVHTASVSRALRGLDKKVSEDTRRNIERIAREMGYRPNSVAASLRTKKTNLVGVLVPDLGNPLFGPLVTGLEVELRAHGLMCLVVHPPDDHAGRRELVGALVNRQVSGLLILTAERSDPMLTAAQQYGIPTVLVNRGSSNRHFSSVVNDDAHSVRQVLEHLVALGHRKIAHVAGSPTSSTSVARLQAFEKLCPPMGVEGVIVQAASCTRAGGFDAAVQTLRKGRRTFGGATAVFASNDMIAMGVLDALRRHGLRVPDDVSLVGHNDIPMVDLLAPPLTTVRVDVEQITRDSARLLLQMLDEPGVRPAKLVAMPTLVVRESTGMAPRRG